MIPGDKRQISVGRLVADQVSRAVALQCSIDHAGDAIELVVVALDGRFDLLRMHVVEPGTLAKEGALSGHLEVKPGQTLVILLLFVVG